MLTIEYVDDARGLNRRVSHKEFAPTVRAAKLRVASDFANAALNYGAGLAAGQ
jgi:hypothetical protein